MPTTEPAAEVEVHAEHVSQEGWAQNLGTGELYEWWLKTTVRDSGVAILSWKEAASFRTDVRDSKGVLLVSALCTAKDDCRATHAKLLETYLKQAREGA